MHSKLELALLLCERHRDGCAFRGVLTEKSRIYLHDAERSKMKTLDAT